MRPHEPAFNPLAVDDRHYLITGAASGIGRSVATLLHRLGARLSLVDRDSAGLDAIVADRGVGIQTYVADLADVEAIDPLVASIVQKMGRLHGVVHCAGIQSIAPVRSLQIEAWRTIFAVNTEAALVLGKAMASKKVYAGDDGSIVFMSSVMGMVGAAGAIPYSMSKAALDGLARSLALELASKRIRVNCIAPGFVETPLFERTAKLWDEQQRQVVADQHPLGFGSPNDIANAVAFLLADTGRWITGSVLVVDGGYLAR
ncbi:SDR family NAD(P)-dependent oxidoreductase [Sphingomonas sp. BK580]|uniref:SDR family NAD(P)-dependent oxidoreductase n=1 Tax=Sphingomonas sp. BK580 TaxID=2586972 RepID=UPI00162051F4|nr:SDR family oxidoreductase [Sphingomonas sp. BK580]MBB3693780.1 NAD(P)-dependent dehydrogenase (short-subunit alcohol dehydrogenase family) [Sphingomonas sp. BK580]